MSPKKQTKPESRANDAALLVRLPQALIDELDQYSERMREQFPGASWSRAAAIRTLLTKALADQKGRRK